MNKSPYNFNPESIVDLRPKLSRSSLSWRDLTAVKIIVFLARLIWRLLMVIFDLVYKFIRSLGLFFVDLGAGTKGVAKSLKDSGVRHGLRLKRFFKFIIDVILIIPRAIIKFLVRIFSIFKSTGTRVEHGLKREAEVLAKPITRKPQSLAWKKIVNFAALLCLIASPFFLVKVWQNLAPLRSSVVSSATSAFNGLFSAKTLIEQQNFSGAETAFNEAQVGFQKAQTDLKAINNGLLALAGALPDQTFKLASESKHLLKAGSLSASIGAEIAAAVAPSDNTNLVYILDRFIKQAIPASDEAKTLANELDKIKVNNLPEQYRDQFIGLRTQAKSLAPSLQAAVVLAQQANIFLGKQIDKRYLLVFQNNGEKRASGGFIGSFATVDFSNGEMKNLIVPKGGSYDTEAGLYQKIVAPEPLWLLNPLWHFWDANWWPDWPTTAKKLEWFYEKSNGPTVDGVISLTPTVMENLLRVHGPVDMTKDYGVTITADNFWLVTQTLSEQKPSMTTEPKKIIGDLMTKLMEELPKNLDLSKTLALVNVLEQSLNEKQILFYFNDPALESSAKAFGWDGAVKSTDHDYLMVVSTNLGGQKSDRAIIETLDHKTEILPDGQIIVNLTITRQHTAYKNQPFVGFRNVDWLRIYVPLNSQLISVIGWRSPEQFYFKTPDPSWEFDPSLTNERQAVTDPASNTKIYQEDGKTVFANWSMVDPGQTATIELKYRLPFTVKPNEAPEDLLAKLKQYIFPSVAERYSLMVQKQPGALQTTFNSNLTIDSGWQPLWSYPTDLNVTNSGWSISKPLNTDLYTTVLFNKK